MKSQEFNSKSLRTSLESFTFAGYQEALTILKSRGTFQCLKEGFTKEVNYFLRHDIDYAPLQAGIMGDLEKELSIHAHYYFLTNSTSYSVYDSTFRKLAKMLIGQGHCIGLHYERLLHGVDAKIEIQSQAKILSEICEVEIDEFSVHNPGQIEKALEFESFGALTNIYEFVSTMGYLSDSNCNWSDPYLTDFVMKNARDYQILIHPEWWSRETKSPLAKILNYQAQKLIDDINQYQEYLLSENKYEEMETLSYIAASNSMKNQIQMIVGQNDSSK